MVYIVYQIDTPAFWQLWYTCVYYNPAIFSILLKPVTQPQIVPPVHLALVIGGMLLAMHVKVPFMFMDFVY